MLPNKESVLFPCAIIVIALIIILPEIHWMEH